MNKLKPFVFIIALFAVLNCFARDKNKVKLIKDDRRQCIDVLVDGKLFTSYLYSDTVSVLKKTVFYPIISSNGVTVTRGFPLKPRAGERVDHPHQIGSWFDYGNVNKIDFWNNSNAIPPEKAPEMGTIKLAKILSMQSGTREGALAVGLNWLNYKNDTLLYEETCFKFIAEKGVRIIDRITTLKALNTPVTFPDDKEGLIAIRVARELELPTNERVELTDSRGNKTQIPVMNNKDVTGDYLSSEGIKGSAVWGTRARWVALSGTIKGKNVTVVIFDNPQNIGFPAYWHAREYGLFAANPLGRNIFSNGKEKLNFSLDAGKSVTFKYRIMIFEGKTDQPAIEKAYQNYTTN
jgi:hypothetical protein